MDEHHEHVKAALRATVIHSPTSYSWFGVPSERLARKVCQTLTPATARSYLLYRLQSELYVNLYSKGFAAPAPRLPARHHATGLTPFVQTLAEANQGNGYWEDGWQVQRVEDSRIIVRRDGLALLVEPGACLSPLGEGIAEGAWVSLRLPKERFGASPGFYMVMGDHGFADDVVNPLVRFYWNLTPEAAASLVREATERLNRAGLPFRLKVASDPALYVRCDSGVIYVLKSDYPAAGEILADVYDRLASRLKQPTPVFTKWLAPGLGLAEDPGRTESFGQNRCRLLADGIIRAFEQGKTSLAERLKAVEERFAEAGLSLERPYLNPGSPDVYGFPPRRQARALRPPEALATRRANASSTSFLRTAEQIATGLAREAIWHDGCCNWLGAAPEEHSPAGRPPDESVGRTYRVLGPDLYDGTSGIALYLAELYAVNRDEATRRVALGAIRQALESVEMVPVPLRLGLYTGWTGIALAAARVGLLLDDGDSCERARQLLRVAVAEADASHELDLIAGSAGAIVGLVVLAAMLDDRSLVALADRLGDDLLRTANRSDNVCSWPSPAFPGQRDLTGYSHGTAGIGAALIELYLATGDPRYRVAAEQAFNYERFWFDRDAGNWPDFRGKPARRVRVKRQAAFETFWCHGAPGIALSRLRAYQALHVEAFKEEALIALRTTAEFTDSWLRSGAANFSLCHGLSGNAEILRYGQGWLGHESCDGESLALEIAQFGRESYLGMEGGWPCGTGGAEVLGLMLGLAGIGHFYLRLYDSTIPSPLCICNSSEWITGGGARRSIDLVGAQNHG